MLIFPRRMTSLLAVALFMLTSVPLFAAATLERTPADQEGPFYPVDRQLDMDSNLLQVRGKKEQAAGNILHLQGKVLTTGGEPVPGVTVEIWQTDPQGRYLHPRDPRSGPRDPYFQYRGRSTTGKDGGYSFTTLVPGEYGSRPPHIHFKVWREGELLLTSQIYFSNHPESRGRFRTNPLQTVELKQRGKGVYEAFFRIVP